MREKKGLSIALVSSYPFTEEPGGVKDFILGLKEALKKHKCKVSIIAPGSKDAQKKGLVDFVLGFSVKVATDQTEFSASFSRKETAKKILEIIKPDIIVIHEPFMPSIGHTIISSITKNREGRPIIIGQFHARREDLNWPLRTAEFVVRHLVRRPKLDKKTVLSLSSGYVSTINNSLNGRIAVSKATKKFWQEKLPAEYKIIYNGIDTSKLTASGPKINSWRNPTSPRLRGTRIIFFAGRHDPRKGIEDLINAFNILIGQGHKDLRLKIAGKGKMTEISQKMVEKLRLQNLVEFVGIMPHSKLIQAYRTADLVVVPSTGGEGFNRIIIEARSCGALVICTDIKGQNEAIGEDLFPFMAQPQNPSSLSKQIMTILSLSKAKKQEIKKRSREDVVFNFDWEVIVKKHLEYYKKLLN
jgi:glycosyltransferase involved in cell wall biosynthesis